MSGSSDRVNPSVTGSDYLERSPMGKNAPEISGGVFYLVFAALLTDFSPYGSQALTQLNLLVRIDILLHHPLQDAQRHRSMT
jgi:hypothetical protein